MVMILIALKAYRERASGACAQDHTMQQLVTTWKVLHVVGMEMKLVVWYFCLQLDFLRFQITEHQTGDSLEVATR